MDGIDRHLMPRQLRVVLFLLTTLLVGGTVGYMLTERWSVHDSLFMTVITLSTVGYGEVRPLTRSGEMFTMLLILGGVGVLAYSFSTTLDYIVAGELQGFLRRQRLERRIAKMQDHYIVCGYGRVGRQVVDELHANEINMVVIDSDPGVGSELDALGTLFINGDSSDDEVLAQAGLDRARGLCTCLPSDATNVFVVLSARRDHPNLFIISRCNQPENQDKLRIAGADQVINPYVITGRRMATQLLYPSVADFLDVFIRRGELELRIQEIVIGAESSMATKTLAECHVRSETGVNVLAIRRNQQTLNTNPGGELVLMVGDELVCLGTPEQLSLLAGRAGDHRRRLRMAK